MERKLQGLNISLAALKSVSVSKQKPYYPASGTPLQHFEVIFSRFVSGLVNFDFSRREVVLF